MFFEQNHLFSWEKQYAEEIETFKECGDEGTVWFGRAAENRIVKFAVETLDRSARVLDLGMANGSLLRKLVSALYSVDGFSGVRGLSTSAVWTTASQLSNWPSCAQKSRTKRSKRLR